MRQKCARQIHKKRYIFNSRRYRGSGKHASVCVCERERGGARLSQATDAAEQTGICPVHLPQRLQQSGAVTGPPVNIRTQNTPVHAHTQWRGTLKHACVAK